MKRQAGPEAAEVDDRQVDEMIARCVATMAAYADATRGRRSEAEMTCEVRAVAREVMGWRLRGDEVERRLLRVVGEELSARHEAGLAGRLHLGFLGAFEEEAGLRLTSRGHERPHQ